MMNLSKLHLSINVVEQDMSKKAASFLWYEKYEYSATQCSKPTRIL